MMSRCELFPGWELRTRSTWYGSQWAVVVVGKDGRRVGVNVECKSRGIALSRAMPVLKALVAER